VRQLLTFARTDTAPPAPVAIDRVLREVETMLRRLVGEDVELVVSTSAPGAAVLTDPGQLELVLLNVAANGRDAMPEGGRLTLRTEHAELSHDDRTVPAVALIVSDTGIGMDDETRARVFEPYFTTMPQGRGTGLGLPAVRDVVLRHRGTIALESAKGRGTTLTIHLPITAESAPTSVRLDGGPPSGTETILVVEDDALVRRTTCELLVEAGYRVRDASGGRMALDLLGSGGIDLVLTDVVMPSMSGRELVRRLGRDFPRVRVLVMSGHARDVIADGLEPETPFLAKPFTFDALARRVREALVP
jgi:CheY-like chemotaxis protein